MGDLESNDPARRAKAIIAIVDANDASHAPFLVDRLDDEDACVRLLAAEGLLRLTGRSFDSAPTSPYSDADNADVTGRWRQYFLEEARRKRAQP